MVADLEARRAQNPEEVSEASIQAVKGSPMGPLAGISDSMFHGTLRPLMSGVSASLALHGIGIAPILFLVVTNAVHVFVSWFTLHQGFRLGGNLFERVDPAGLKHIMEGAAIAGLMAVGALVANWLSFGLAKTLVYTTSKYTLPIQSMLDGILPGLLPLLTTLVVYYAVRKGVKYTWIMVTLLAISLIFGGIIKVFA
jgi:PTS system mannose-specific IID component